MGEEMQKKQFTIIVFVVYFFISISQAAEYFVDPNGNDTTGSGTISAPYKTITKAYSVVSAGDTIYIRGGTHIYSTTITISKSEHRQRNIICLHTITKDSAEFFLNVRKQQ
jgi:hypothetical protein